jgi:type VI secretion system secreted protein VgrG
MIVGLQSRADAQLFSLGTAQSFAVLGATTVTNTGFSVLTGDLGVSPGTAITGFPDGTFTGTLHAGDATALQAQNDAGIAYTALAGMAPTQNLAGQELGGLTFLPGVYRLSSTAQLTGTVTLDAQGRLDALFVFQIGTALTTATDSSVVMINGGDSSNVFWQVGSSATLGTGTDFMGNILADQSITVTTNANMLFGRALALHGAVTLDTNRIANTGRPFMTEGAGALAVAAPEPATIPLLASLALPLAGLVMRRRLRR